MVFLRAACCNPTPERASASPLPDHATGKGPVRQGHRWQMRAGVQNRDWVFGWNNGSSRILKPSLAGQQLCLRGEEEAHPQLLFAGPARSRYCGPSHFTQGLQLPDFRLPFPQLLSLTHISSTFPCPWVTPKSQPCLQRAARRSKGTSQWVQEEGAWFPWLWVLPASTSPAWLMLCTLQGSVASHGCTLAPGSGVWLRFGTGASLP